MHNTLPTCQSFRCKTAYFTEQNVLVKQPVRIDYLMKERLRGALAGKQAICKPRHWNLGIGIGIGTDITNVIISSSIRSMDPKLSRMVT